jgi:hypothetical protein
VHHVSSTKSLKICLNVEITDRHFTFIYMHMCIQGVSEISTLILTGNRTHQKEQLFSLPFWRKTLRSGLKK